MIQEEIKVQVLKSSEGFSLTQARDVAIQDRVISNQIFLAVTDSVDNWKEITKEEADRFMAEQEEIAKKLLEND